MLDILFLATDAVSLALDVKQLADEGPSAENARNFTIDIAATAVDLVCTALPGATGGRAIVEVVATGGDFAMVGSKIEQQLARAGIKGVQTGIHLEGDLGDLPGGLNLYESSGESGVKSLREAYESEVRGLSSKAASMREIGYTSEDIARTLHADRRALGVKYKDMTPEALRERIYLRNAQKYGDPLGPTLEWLLDHGKTWEDIIESACRPGGGDIIP